MARSIEEIQKENEEIMAHDTTGQPHNMQMKRLASNTVESVAILHDEVAALKQITEEYTASSERFSKASRTISIAALTIALLSLLASLYLGFRADQSDREWQNAQLKALQEINNNLSR